MYQEALQQKNFYNNSQHLPNIYLILSLGIARQSIVRLFVSISFTAN